MRGIDHVVLPVRDLERLAQTYTSLGFTVTPQNNHPFGTANRLVQLNGVFLEPLTVAERDLIPEHDGDAFSFAAFNRDFLDRREGASMLVLESGDAWAELAEIASAGIRTFAPFEFSRDAILPDGTTARVGFRLGFAVDPGLPELAFFVCQQLAPEHFWKPEFQAHPNTAETVLEVALVVDEPEQLRRFFDAFVGGRGCLSEDGLSYETPRGRICLMTPRIFANRFGETCAPGQIGAIVIGVADETAARACLAAGGHALKDTPAGMMVDSGDTFGVCIVFAPTRGR